nr:MAG TPA: hypothetical protein [Caudoviricetes sp.]
MLIIITDAFFVIYVNLTFIIFITLFHIITKVKTLKTRMKG